MKTIIIILTLLMVSLPLCGQLSHPWWVVDGGGGTSTGLGFVLNASVGQPGIQKSTSIDTGTIQESGFIPGLRNFGGTWTSATLSAQLAWNLLSVPLQTNDMRKTTMFPAAVSSAFGYEPGGYVDVETLLIGSAYWMRFISPDTHSIFGTRLNIDTIPVYVGWNMIGSLAYPMLTSSVVPISPVAITSSFFAYSPTVGYYNVDTLKPGMGSWIKVNHAGLVILNNSVPLYAQNASEIVLERGSYLSKKQLLNQTSGFNNLIIQDSEGRERSIFYSEHPQALDLDKYQLPPLPPGDMLDVRFASQRYVEVPGSENASGEVKYPLKINGGAFPITINWDHNSTEGKMSVLRVRYSNRELEEISLVGKGSKTFHDGDGYLGADLVVSTTKVVELPREYALHENYPNPFNPVTKIQYDLPKDGRVRLTIYDLLGREVETIVDGVQEAGYKSIEWNAAGGNRSNVSSGVYFYRLEAGNYRAVKKMMLLK